MADKKKNNPAKDVLQKYKDDIKQDAAERMVTAADIVPKEMLELLKEINFKQMQDTANGYAQIMSEAIKAAQKNFSTTAEIYKTMQTKEWKEATDALRQLADIVSNSEFLQGILSDAVTFYEAVEEELKKPEYEGLTAVKLEELADDPAADPKYKQLWQQAQDNAKAAIREREAQDDTGKIPLPLLQSIHPERHIMPNSTLMNELAGITGKKPINAGAHDLPVIPEKKRQKEITSYIMAVYEPEQGITSNLSEYERSVSDTVMSIWQQAQKEGKPAAFTADSLYRAMPGRGERASARQKKAITETIEKFLRLYMDIDATDELRKRNVIGEKETYHIRNYYLNADEHEYRLKNGKPVKAWRLNRKPIILDYAEQTGQIISVPAKYIAVEKVKTNKGTGKEAASGELITMNADRQAMTSYMLRRIAVMSNDLARAKEAKRSYDRRRKREKDLEEKPLESFREQKDIISFETLFKVTGTQTTDRKQKGLNRNFCFDVLDYWKVCSPPLIKDYEPQKKGRSITGIKILF